MRKLLAGVILSLVPFTANATTLEQAVVKLIIDVHNLKQQVRELQGEVDDLKEKLRSLRSLQSQRSPSTKWERVFPRPSPTTYRKATKSRKSPTVAVSDGKVVVLKGKLIPTSKTCLLATVIKVRQDGVNYLKSILPEDAPLYLRKWGKYKVFLTLPEYCDSVRKYIKDAKVVEIEVRSESGKGAENSKFHGKQEPDTNGKDGDTEKQ